MDNFYEEIENICKNNAKVAMFIDMDGTIVEYRICEEEVFKEPNGMFSNARPLRCVVDKLEKINKDFDNIDLYILSLSKNTKIVAEKQEWLRKNAPFIKPENWIIVNKQTGEYSSKNRDIIKALKMKDKVNNYDHLVFVDDDHKILVEAKHMLEEKIDAYHVSSVIV